MFLLNLIKVARFMLPFMKTQNRFNDQFIDGFLASCCQQHNQSLKESTVFKIKKYYAVGIPLLATTYKKLYGRHLSENERKNAALMGIYSPLIDDFTDEKSLSNEALDHLTTNPKGFSPANLSECVARKAGMHLMNQVKNPEDCLHALQQVIAAQHRSQKQLQPGNDRKELLQITLEKGGWAIIFYHYAIDEKPSQQMLNLLYLKGGLLQLCNDIFDIYKDHKEGIETYANTCDDFKGFEAYFSGECRRFVQEASMISVKKADREFFVTFMVLGMARALVALRMFSKLQVSLGGGRLPFSQLSRKQLICDMEKPVNLLKMVWFAYKLQA